MVWVSAGCACGRGRTQQDEHAHVLVSLQRGRGASLSKLSYPLLFVLILPIMAQPLDAFVWHNLNQDVILEILLHACAS